MTSNEIIRTGISRFNDRQRDTNRNPLSTVESNMLANLLHAALAEETGRIRDELESAASQADLETQKELEWAIDVIITTIRQNNQLSVRVADETVRKMSAGFSLRVERDEGWLELEVIRNSDEA